MVKLVNTRDSKSRAFGLGGSSPLSGTRYQNQSDSFGFVVFCSRREDLKRGEFILFEIFPTEGRRKISGQNLTRRGRASAVAVSLCLRPRLGDQVPPQAQNTKTKATALVLVFCKSKKLSNETKNNYTKQMFALPPRQTTFPKKLTNLQNHYRLKFQFKLSKKK